MQDNPTLSHPISGATAFRAQWRSSLVGNWLLAAGPTFILPTATETLIGQKKWQFGPTVAVGYAGRHFLTYVFTQQWFLMFAQATRDFDGFSRTAQRVCLVS